MAASCDEVLAAIYATPDHRCECRGLRWSDADDVRQESAIAALVALRSMGEIEHPAALARRKLWQTACEMASAELAGKRGRRVTMCDTDRRAYGEQLVWGSVESEHMTSGYSSERVSTGLECSESQTPIDRLIRAEDDADMARVIGTLTAAQQQAIRLRFWEGLSVVEIGAAMGLSESAAAGHLKRALRALRVRYAN